MKMSHLNEDFNNLTTVGFTAATAGDYSIVVDPENDGLNLNIFKSDKNESNEMLTTQSTTPLTSKTNFAHPQRPTTPVPPKKFMRKSQNLFLKIKASPESEITTKTDDDNENSTAADIKNKTNDFSSTRVPSTPFPTPSTASTGKSSTKSSTTVFPHEQLKTIKRLDIGFENISFNTKTGLFKRETKNILNGISGKFCSGELSAIVGPSGAGKSTFLNILSAYTSFGYTGNLNVNDYPRDTKAFKPNVAFIMQDTSLQPYLTVKEAMHFAAFLKIGTHMTKSERRERVRKILEAIGMYDNRHTRTGNLSGGQKKRLAIALELVNNPPVLILDEPTSGLDSSTSNQCISLLKKLALEGRTVICTIHQPSALTFEMFDHLYAIAEGHCIYSGGTANLVPFLAEVGLKCPESYNPADYLMEIATNDYGKQNFKLTEKIQNGHNNGYRQTEGAKKKQIEAMKKVDTMMNAGMMTPVTAPALTPTLSNTPNYSKNHLHHHHNPQKFKPLTPINEMSSKVWDSCGLMTENLQSTKEVQKPSKLKMPLDPTRLCRSENIYATPFYRQLGVLLLRTFLILWRDHSLTTMRFVIHFVTALLIGFIYYDIGNDAGNALNIFRYVFYTIMFIMYCAFSSILVKFPLEFPIVSREHFNRWYSLRAYYVAMTLADIPIQLICTSLFVFTTYFLTGQPLEFFRLSLFSLIVFLTALVGQSIGLTVGASLSVQLGAIFGPFFICPFLTFSGFFLQHKDAPIYLKWLFHVSFLRYSLDGSMLALFGYDRPKLECSDMYCHYARPNFFLKDLDMTNANYEFAMLFLFALFLGLRIIAFYIMSFRLRLFR